MMNQTSIQNILRHHLKEMNRHQLPARGWLNLRNEPTNVSWFIHYFAGFLSLNQIRYYSGSFGILPDQWDRRANRSLPFSIIWLVWFVIGILLMARRKLCKKIGLCYFSGNLRSKASLCLRGDFIYSLLFMCIILCNVGILVFALGVSLQSINYENTLCSWLKKSQCRFCSAFFNVLQDVGIVVCA